MVSGISGGSNGMDVSAMWQEMLKRTDKDGDGKISKEEMQAGMPAKGGGPGVDDIFSKIDTNADGYIDESENTTWVENMPKGQPPAGPDPFELFETADTDSDGKISKAEFKAAAPKDSDDSTTDETFDAMDTNHDGYVSTEEYAAAMEKVGLMPRQPPSEGFSALA
jgi:Ca2+-binding EF-hand superfamily protein